MLLKIVYTDNSFIQIKLFDNEPVRKWFNFFKEKNSQPNFYKFNTEGIIHGVDFLKSQHLVKLSPKWKIIKQSIQNLKDLGFNIPAEFDVSNKTHIDQHFFNRLHRFFTYNILWWHKQDTPNPYDPNFKLPKGMSIHTWHSIIDPINLAIHHLECKIHSTENRKYVQQYYPLETFCYWNTDTTFPNWMEFNDSDQLENFKFFNTPDKPIVFLSDNILGKSVIQSFLDNDDPSAEDCSGRKGSFGSFWIDFKCNRKLLYKSERFISWLNQHNLKVSETPFEFPIGYVEYTTHPYKKFKSSRKFKEIIFTE